MRETILAFFFLFFSLFLQTSAVDYLSDQNSQLINQFLLNPESVVSNTEKLLAIAQYISKTLDNNNQTIDEVQKQINSMNKTQNATSEKRLGLVKFNAHYFVKDKCFVQNASISKNGNVEGTLQVMRRTETIQYFSNTLRTNTLQASVIYNQNSGIFIHGDVILGKVKMNQGLKATSFLMSGMKQWNLISHDDFDQETTHEWNYNKINRCSSLNENYFLGGHCNLAADEISKMFLNLPAHEKIRVQATFHMFDNWQGEYGFMKIDDQRVWKQNGFATTLKTMNLCGNLDYDDPHMNLKIDEVLNHTASNFTLTFGTNLNKNPCDASFAIDDVIIYVK